MSPQRIHPIASGVPICLLVSGGLDSAALLWRLLQKGSHITPLYIRCGLRWEDVELYWLRRFLQALRAPNLQPLVVLEVPLRGVYGAHWSMGGMPVPGSRSADQAVYLPGRNVLLLTSASIVCARRHLPTIALGLLKGNPFGDASPAFLRAITRALRQALGFPLRILAPLAHTRKIDVIRAARHAPLGLTFSCLNPQGRLHCGRCNKCAERRRAFHAAGVLDPTRYA